MDGVILLIVAFFPFSLVLYFIYTIIKGKGGSKGAMYTEERIMKLQAKLDELQAKQSAGNTVIAPSTTTNTTNQP